MTTTWRPVPEWVGYYEVSDDGEVRSVGRSGIGDSGRTYTMKGRTLRTSVTPKGYHMVTFTRPGVRRTYAVHRLVGEAFLGPLPEGLQTCHNDGDKGNNAVGNLRYDTQAANELDKRRHGGNVNASKDVCPQGHRYDAVNTIPRKDGSRGCRICHREQQARYRAKRKAQDAA